MPGSGQKRRSDSRPVGSGLPRRSDGSVSAALRKSAKPEVAIQMGIEPPPLERKGRISHLYVYRQQIDERQCLNLNDG
jgi:hypothetical protein